MKKKKKAESPTSPMPLEIYLTLGLVLYKCERNV
jgi:hypothetical protein